jgi:hypothetical protein
MVAPVPRVKGSSQSSASEVVPFLACYRFVTSWCPSSAIPLVTPLLGRLSTGGEIPGDGDRHEVWQRPDTGVPDVRTSSSRTVGRGLFPVARE